MSCGKICQKLWNNYLTKYGDYRERLQLIKQDEQCSKQFRLPPIQKQSKKENNRIEKCDSSLPSECCISQKNRRKFLSHLNKNELDQLEKIIEAENFPDNIFSRNIEVKPSIDNELEGDGSQLLTSSLNTNSIKQSTQKSKQLTNTHDRMMNQPRNPYAQFLERFRQTKKVKPSFSNNIIHQPFDSKIDPQLHKHIEKFLSFLQSLDNQQNANTLDENTLINLFSIDNHLTSSMYIPTRIQQIDKIPKTILNSLKKSPEDEHILIEDAVTRKKLNKSSIKTVLDEQKSIFTEQDVELNSRLSNTYTIKAFKEFLLQRNPSARLPKLFDDLKQN